jgi:hypothetical protein
MAKAAVEAAGAEASTAMTGKFFSTAAGVLKWAGDEVPGNQMAVVVLASVVERVYYEGRYDASNSSSPVCYAFGRKPEGMTPYAEAESPQHENCEDCPQNKWDTGANGKGKACREQRRLALIPAGTFDKGGAFVLEEDPQAYLNRQIGYLRVPVTSVKTFAGWVLQTNDHHQRPPWGVVCKVTIVADAARQVAHTFETLEKLPDSVLDVVYNRSLEAAKSVIFPYSKNQDRPAPPARGKARKF